MKRLFLLTLLMAFGLGPSLAWADAASESQLQFDLGADAYKRREYAQALVFFMAANRLAPNPNTTRSIAELLAYLKRPRDAFNTYEDYLAFGLPEPEQKLVRAAQDKLRGKLAVLDIQTSPAGAELFVDRDSLGSVGRAPRRVAVAVDPATGAQARTLIARAAGYLDARHDVQLSLGEVVNVNLTLVARAGSLQLVSTPPGARIFPEGRSDMLCETPCQVALAEGPHRLVARADKHLETLQTVEVLNGQSATLHFTLTRDPNTLSALQVASTPSGADVFLDALPLGKTSLARQQLEPGPYRLTLRMDNRESLSQPVLLEPGSVTRVDAQLAKPPGKYRRVWRYLGYLSGAALLGAGLGTGLAARHQRDAFLDDPSRAAYDRVGKLNLAADLLSASGLVTLFATGAWHLFSAAPAHSRGTSHTDR